MDSIGDDTVLSLLDVIKGYVQVPMAEEDR